MNWKALSSAMRTFCQSDYNGLKSIINKPSFCSSVMFKANSLIEEHFFPLKRGRVDTFSTFNLFMCFSKQKKSQKQDKKHSFSIILLSQLIFHTSNDLENITNS